MNSSRLITTVGIVAFVFMVSAALVGAQILQTLVSFNGTNGKYPNAALTLGNDGDFYGTTYSGGSNGYGTIFKFTTNGTLTTLVSFANTNGANPNVGLTLGTDGNFYGTTSQGGSSNNGTMFLVTTNGGLTTLFSFTNGANPNAELTLGSDGNFYGTTYYGGSGVGTIFKVSTNDILTTLLSFNGTNGAYPSAALTLGNDGNFYGTTERGGTNLYYGTVFKVTTNGILTTLFSFDLTNGLFPAALTLGNDGNLYGTTQEGGNFNLNGGYGYGTVFKVTTNGLLTTLVSFNGTNGGNPNAALTLGNDGNFFSTTSAGGSDNFGTMFKVSTNDILTTLVSFNNGAYPCAALTLGNDGNLYGTTPGNGVYNTMFMVTTNGTFATLDNNLWSDYLGTVNSALTLGNDGHFYGTTTNSANDNVDSVFMVTTNGSLTIVVGSNGSGLLPVNFQGRLFYPNGLTLGIDGNFYGTTATGSAQYDYGAIFMVTTNGTLTALFSFNFTDGAYPSAALALGNDGNFYGTTQEGGSSDAGTVFMWTTNGPLHTVGHGTFISLFSFNFADGAYPSAALTLGNDGNFYGTTQVGGDNGYGTIFKVTTNGVLTTLFSFNGTNGAYPSAALTLGSDGNFYGTTSGGGSSDAGTVFILMANGTLTTLFSFNVTNGANPNGLTLGSDGNFYGTTSQGGSSGVGTVFRLLTPLAVSPAITSQPQSLTVTNGHSASFTLTAFGLSSLAYQWFFNGTNLNGATNILLTLQNAFPANAGDYTVVVTNTYTSITSNPAKLTVFPLNITAPMMFANGQFHFSFDTATGVNYAVEYSTNLTQWFPLVTLGGIGVPFTLIDPNTVGTRQRFYRISLSPQ